MRKHIIRVATVGMFAVLIIPTAVTSKFFTKEDIKQENTKNTTIACKYEEKCLELSQMQEVVESEKEPDNQKASNVVTEKTNLQEAKKVNTQKEEKKEEKIVKTSKTETSTKETQNTKVVENKNTVATQYKGYSTVGKIEIPKTGVNIPILSKVTVKGMEVAPCILYSTGELNKNGNNLIVGHNYRNGTIFSNNKKLQIGDKIYVTTLEGKKVEYTIYNKFVVNSEEVDYFMKESEKPEITLSTCTDDEEQRLIIMAKIK